MHLYILGEFLAYDFSEVSLRSMAIFHYLRLLDIE
jgi:hypothetical protein